jgi:hypothetical protein
MEPFPAATRTKGSLQLRLTKDTLLLDASFPALDQETADRLRQEPTRKVEEVLATVGFA